MRYKKCGYCQSDGCPPDRKYCMVSCPDCGLEWMFFEGVYG
jgi:hypothetical protein